MQDGIDETTPLEESIGQSKEKPRDNREVCRPIWEIRTLLGKYGRLIGKRAR